MGRHIKLTDCDSSPRQIYCRIPVFIGMMLEERVAAYGFRNRAEIILYLVDNYIDNQKGQPASEAALKIFDFITPRRRSVISFAPTMSFIITMPGDRSVELAMMLESTEFRTRHNFINATIEAFLTASPRFVKRLSDELNESHLANIANERIEFKTYVSEWQCRALKQKAESLNTDMSGLLKLAANVLFELENSEEASILPNVLIKQMKEVMAIKGSTLKRFNRDIPVALTMPKTADQRKVFQLMKKYGIQGYHEFTRRLVLFFLDSEKYVDECTAEDDKLNNLSVEGIGNYQYELLSRRDFARSVYQ